MYRRRLSTALVPLLCAQCGAPLPVSAGDAFLLCVYCNTAHRLTAPHGEVRAESSAVAKVEVARVRDLIGRGRREEAIAVYLRAAACSRAEAEAVIAAWGAQLARATPMRGILSGLGWAIVLAALSLLGGGAAALATDSTTAPVAVPTVVVGLSFTLLFVAPLFRTLRYLFAARGTATIVRHALIGRATASVVHRMLIDVQGSSGPSFRTEVTMHARANAKVFAGRRFRVKYFVGRPSSVIFTGKVT